MNYWIIGEKFGLVLPYAVALNTIFVSLTFSSGAPILLWIGTFALFF